MGEERAGAPAAGCTRARIPRVEPPGRAQRVCGAADAAGAASRAPRAAPEAAVRPIGRASAGGPICRPRGSREAPPGSADSSGSRTVQRRPRRPRARLAAIVAARAACCKLTRCSTGSACSAISCAVVIRVVKSADLAEGMARRPRGVMRARRSRDARADVYAERNEASKIGIGAQEWHPGGAVTGAWQLPATARGAAQTRSERRCAVC